MIPFPFNENWFSCFVADHLLVGQLCTNSKSDRSLLSCLKVTQCSTSEIGDALLYNSCSLLIQVYDNRTIASTLKMQIRTVQRLRAQVNASDDPSDGYGYSLWWGFKWGPHHATSHLRSQLESQYQSVLGCAEECGDPLVQSGSQWQTLGMAAGLGASDKSKETQAWLQKECNDFVPFSHWPPPLPTCTCWTTSFGHTSRTSPTWLLTTPKPAWLPPSAEYWPSSHRLLWKRHGPSSRSVSRRWLRLKAATLNRCQLYYKIKLSELIFSIKVLK